MPSSSQYVRFERNQQQGVIKNRRHRRPAPQPKSVAGSPLITIAAAPFTNGTARRTRGTEYLSTAAVLEFSAWRQWADTDE
jgi:hypothetical protein